MDDNLICRIEEVCSEMSNEAVAAAAEPELFDVEVDDVTQKEVKASFGRSGRSTLKTR